MSKKLLLGLAAGVFGVSVVTAIIILLQNSKNPAGDYEKLRKEAQETLDSSLDSQTKQELLKELEKLKDYSEQNAAKLADLISKINQNLAKENEAKNELTKKINALDSNFAKKEQLQKELNDLKSLADLEDLSKKVEVAKQIEEALAKVNTEDAKKSLVDSYSAEATKSVEDLQKVLADVIKQLDRENEVLADSREKAKERTDFIEDKTKAEEFKKQLDAAVDQKQVDEIRAQIEKEIENQKLNPEKAEANKLNEKISDQKTKEDFAKQIEEAKTAEEISKIVDQITEKLKEQGLSEKEINDAKKEALAEKINNSNLEQATKDSLNEELKNADTTDEIKNIDTKIDNTIKFNDALKDAQDEVNKLNDSDKKTELDKKIVDLKNDQSLTEAQKIEKLEEIQKEAAQVIADAAKKAEDAISRLRDSGDEELNRIISSLEQMKDNSFTEKHFNDIETKANEEFKKKTEEAKKSVEEAKKAIEGLNITGENPLPGEVSTLENEITNIDDLSIAKIQEIINKANEIKEKADAIKKVDQDLAGVSNEIKDQIKKDILDGNNVEEDVKKIEEIKKVVDSIKDKASILENTDFKDESLNNKISEKTTEEQLKELLEEVTTKAKEELTNKVNEIKNDTNNPSTSEKLNELIKDIESLNSTTDNTTFERIKEDIKDYKEAKEKAVAEKDKLENNSAKQEYKDRISTANTPEELNKIKEEIEQYKEKYDEAKAKLDTFEENAKSTLINDLNSDKVSNLEEVNKFLDDLKALEDKKQEAKNILDTAADLSEERKTELQKEINNAATVVEVEKIIDKIKNPNSTLDADTKALVDKIKVSDLHSEEAKKILIAKAENSTSSAKLKEVQDQITALEDKKTELNAKVTEAATGNKISSAQKQHFLDQIKDATLVEKDPSNVENDLNSIATKFDEFVAENQKLINLLNEQKVSANGNTTDSVIEQEKSEIYGLTDVNEIKKREEKWSAIKDQKQTTKEKIDQITNDAQKSALTNDLQNAKTKEEVDAILAKAEKYKSLEDAINSLDKKEEVKTQLKDELSSAISSQNPDAIQKLEQKIAEIKRLSDAISAQIDALENTSDEAKNSIKETLKEKGTTEELNTLARDLDVLKERKNAAVAENNKITDQTTKQGFATEIQAAKTPQEIQNVIAKIQAKLDENKDLETIKNELKQQINDFYSSKQPSTMAESVKNDLIAKVEALDTKEKAAELRKELSDKKDRIAEAFKQIEGISSTDSAVSGLVSSIADDLKSKLTSADTDTLEEIRAVEELAAAKKDALAVIERLNDKNDLLTQLKNAATKEAVEEVKNKALETLSNAKTTAEKAVAKLNGSDGEIQQKQNELKTKLEELAKKPYTEAELNAIVTEVNNKFNPEKSRVEGLINGLADTNTFKAELKKELTTKDAAETLTIGDLKELEKKVELANKKQEALDVLNKLIDNNDRATKISTVNNSTNADEITRIKTEAEAILTQARTEAQTEVNKLDGHADKSALDTKLSNAQTQQQLVDVKNEAAQKYTEEFNKAKAAVEELRSVNPEKYNELNSKLTDVNKSTERDTVTELRAILEQAQQAKQQKNKEKAIADAKEAVRSLPDKAVSGSTTETLESRLLKELDSANITTERANQIKEQAQKLKPLMESALSAIDKLSDGTAKNNAISAVLSSSDEARINQEKQSAENTLNAKRTEAQNWLNKTVGLVSPAAGSQDRTPISNHSQLQSEFNSATTEDNYKRVIDRAKEEFTKESEHTDSRIALVGSTSAQEVFKQQKQSADTVEKLREINKKVNALITEKDAARAIINKLKDGDKKTQLLQELDNATTNEQAKTVGTKAQAALDEIQQATLREVEKLKGHEDYDAKKAEASQKLTEAQYDTIKNLVQGKYDDEKRRAQKAVDAIKTNHPDKYTELNNKLNAESQSSDRDNIEKLRAIKSEAENQSNQELLDKKQEVKNKVEILKGYTDATNGYEALKAKIEKANTLAELESLDRTITNTLDAKKQEKVREVEQLNATSGTSASQKTSLIAEINKADTYEKLEALNSKLEELRKLVDTQNKAKQLAETIYSNAEDHKKKENADFLIANALQSQSDLEGFIAQMEKDKTELEQIPAIVTKIKEEAAGINDKFIRDSIIKRADYVRELDYANRLLYQAKLEKLILIPFDGFVPTADFKRNLVIEGGNAINYDDPNSQVTLSLDNLKSKFWQGPKSSVKTDQDAYKEILSKIDEQALAEFEDLKKPFLKSGNNGIADNPSQLKHKLYLYFREKLRIKDAGNEETAGALINESSKIDAISMSDSNKTSQKEKYTKLLRDFSKYSEWLQTATYDRTQLAGNMRDDLLIDKTKWNEALKRDWLNESLFNTFLDGTYKQPAEPFHLNNKDGLKLAERVWLEKVTFGIRKFRSIYPKIKAKLQAEDRNLSNPEKKRVQTFLVLYDGLYDLGKVATMDEIEQMQPERLREGFLGIFSSDRLSWWNALYQPEITDSILSRVLQPEGELANISREERFNILRDLGNVYSEQTANQFLDAYSKVHSTINKSKQNYQFRYNYN
ncbi:GA module-containing protein [Mycoplasma procyoni]|uniref:GA module-containing protein n=1 Tax=Mycoplasma procyoni TaxID=568784 RepID=UPI00197C9B7E|nr:GA module-containing protein [Mycoplasma procyoni]MBN3534702.1 GA module-containing protein [Mycoplasma procyoni]